MEKRENLEHNKCEMMIVKCVTNGTHGMLIAFCQSDVRIDTVFIISINTDLLYKAWRLDPNTSFNKSNNWFCNLNRSIDSGLNLITNFTAIPFFFLCVCVWKEMSNRPTSMNSNEHIWLHDALCMMHDDDCLDGCFFWTANKAYMENAICILYILVEYWAIWTYESVIHFSYTFMFPTFLWKYLKDFRLCFESNWSTRPSCRSHVQMLKWYIFNLNE